jgi:hypothetical protein
MEQIFKHLLVSQGEMMAKMKAEMGGKKKKCWTR